MRRALILSFVLVVSLAVPATADRDRGTDGEDSPGPLDIKSVAHGHAGAKLLVHRLRTYEPWGPKDLRGYNRWIVFWISTNDDPSDPEGFERHIWIDYMQGRLRAVVLRPSGGLHATLDERVGKATVRRPNKRTVVVRFPKRFLGKNVTNYRWYADTSWKSRRGPCSSSDGSTTADNSHPFGQDGVCFDQAPRHRDLRHVL
jgi:hypothetical protein